MSVFARVLAAALMAGAIASAVAFPALIGDRANRPQTLTAPPSVARQTLRVPAPTVAPKRSTPAVTPRRRQQVRPETALASVTIPRASASSGNAVLHDSAGGGRRHPAPPPPFVPGPIPKPAEPPVAAPPPAPPATPQPAPAPAPATTQAPPQQDQTRDLAATPPPPPVTPPSPPPVTTPAPPPSTSDDDQGCGGNHGGDGPGSNEGHGDPGHDHDHALDREQTHPQSGSAGDGRESNTGDDHGARHADHGSGHDD